MTDEAHGYLLQQFEIAWKLAEYRLNELKTQECLWLNELQQKWRAALHKLTDADLRSADRTRWPFRDRPLGDLVRWVNIELTKNAAEIGCAPFLYAVRAG